MRKLVLDVAGPRWFGELIRNQGRVGGQQVVAQKAVASILQVPSASNQERVARTNCAGTGYSNFWWYPAKTDGALYASGRFGQRLYVDPKNELAIAQFGSYADTRARAVSSGQATATHENALRDSQALVALARAVSGRIGGAARQGKDATFLSSFVSRSCLRRALPLETLSSCDDDGALARLCTIRGIGAEHKCSQGPVKIYDVDRDLSLETESTNTASVLIPA